MTRLFTFGCSFTHYHWPTWADIMARQFDKFYNYGRTGAGNQYIFHSIIEADLVHKFTKNDIIAIMWTNVEREDRYVQGKWITPGNIRIQSVYDRKFVKNFADKRGYYIKSLSMIYAINKILDQIGCGLIQFSMVDLHRGINDSHVKDLLEHYQPVLDRILPSVHQVIFDYDWQNRPNNITYSDLTYGVLAKRREIMSWQTWYNDIKDPSWPDCPTEKDFIKLPDHIQQECKELFGYAPGFKKDRNFQWWNKQFVKAWLKKYIGPKVSRADLHPTPCEHLEYLGKVLPNFKIDQKSKQWVETIDNMLHSSQDYTELWMPNDPRRW